MLKDELINELKIKCIKMMELTFNDVNIALEAIKNHTANKVNDDTIDNYHMEIESECLKILLKEQVYSKDLRIVTGILKLVDDIERIGDHAEDLLWCNSKLSTEEKFIGIKNLDILLSEISEMVTLTLKSYLTEDIELANNLIQSDDNIDIEQLLDAKRQDAMALTVEQAMRRHASAIINVRFTTTNLGHNMIECQVSGMAVKAEKIDE